MAGRTIYESPHVTAKPGEEIITSTCGHNCGGRCVVNAHVVDGKMVRISTDPRTWSPEHPPLQACVRGFGMVERVYHPGRLLHPMRRRGPRGSCQWERVSWDEALDEVATEMRRVRDRYGADAILDSSCSGNTALLHNRMALRRLLHLFGGSTELWSNLSAEAEAFPPPTPTARRQASGRPAARESITGTRSSSSCGDGPRETAISAPVRSST
jgi:anaerobic dimethyl sulfoxide reductase subunit A